MSAAVPVRALDVAGVALSLLVWAGCSVDDRSLSVSDANALGGAAVGSGGSRSAVVDGSPGLGGDGRVVPDSSIDSVVPVDGSIAPDAVGSCAIVCSPGTTRCNTGAVQTCQALGGCGQWETTDTCGGHQVCTAAGGPAACACLPSVCSLPGNICQDARTLVTCAIDDDGCPYAASSQTCSSTQSCSGLSPAAVCSAQCADSCRTGQTTCTSGGLASCTLGTNGCLAYGAPVACGAHQSCVGAAGSAACVCNADSLCTAAGPICAGPAGFATCLRDAEGCFYQSGTTSCAQPTPDCAQGACACLGTACAGRCVDGFTDASHCGRCGHDCLGGQCVAGQCQPITLATGLDGPDAIAVDGTSVYFAVRGRCALDGTACTGSVGKVPNNGGLVATLASGLQAPYAIANDSSFVYFTTYDFYVFNTGSVTRVPLGGGQLTMFASGESTNWGVAVDRSNVYWTFLNTANQGVIGRAALSGGPVTTLYTAPAGYQFNALAVDATSVYWINFGPPACSADSGLCTLADSRIMKVPTGGGTATTLASGQAWAMGIAIDSASVYWTNYDSGEIMKVGLNGGTPVRLASAQGRPPAIAVDAVNVYWTTPGSVMAIPIGGGNPIVVVPNSGGGAGIAVDATAIYWLTGSSFNGEVRKVAKP